MSEEPRNIAWMAFLGSAAVISVATLGYFLGSPNKPEKPQPKPQQGGMGGFGGPGGSPGAPGGLGGMTQDDLINLLMRQQQQKQQQQQQQQQPQQLFSPQDRPKTTPSVPQPATKPSPQPTITNSGTVASEPSFPEISEQEIRAQAVEQKMNHFAVLVRSGNLDKASELVAPILDEIEEVFGKSSQEWIFFSYNAGRFYLEQRQWDNVITYMTNVISAILSGKKPVPKEQIMFLFSTATTLNKAFDHEGRTKESVEMATSVLKAFQEILEEVEIDSIHMEDEEEIEEVRSLYISWVYHILSIHRRLGNWKTLNALAEEIKTRFAAQPESLENVIEGQVSSLHQEGKTANAIQILEEYYEKIKDMTGPAQRVVHWCLGRTAKFHFYLDQFAESRDLLIRLIEYSEKNNFPVSNDYLMDLVSVYLELDDEENAMATLERIKATAVSDVMTRSKYLITCDASVGSEYSLNLKVCRVPPRRQEGEAEEDESDMKRKLDNFYLETTFENPTGGEPIVVEQPVDYFDVDVRSTSLPGLPVPDTWYLVKMVIYKDSSKEEQLGKHWQLVFSPAPYGNRTF